MTTDRAPKLLGDLVDALRAAQTLAARGRDAFDTDLAVPLAFEALSNRVGDLCKQLVAADPARFSEEDWSLAARNRDVIVHHYHRIRPDTLWATATADFPRLLRLAERKAE